MLADVLCSSFLSDVLPQHGLRKEASGGLINSFYFELADYSTKKLPGWAVRPGSEGRWDWS
ncbi:MAG: hypothetical protein GTO03_15200 [Planctomycetales bacterium]|nr:hypothetical protein [Planctomycetales bacterium]